MDDEKKYPTSIAEIGKINPAIFAQYDLLISRYLKSLEALTLINCDLESLIISLNDLAFNIPESKMNLFIQHHTILKGMKSKIEDAIRGINQ